MAYLFGDSFDLYAAVTDPMAGYWDSGNANFSFVTGRFGGRCVQSASSSLVYLVKSSGANDAVHHIVCAFQQNSATLSGSSLGMYLQLSDGATNQCCIVFRSDGAIVLTSATPGGTALATYTGAITLKDQWFAFEFEVIIHPTAGRFRVRKNNSTSDDFDSGATLNTRPGTNSYANKLTLGMNANISAHQIDDLLWRSDASSVPFVGDIRCYTRMPASDASVQFSRSPLSASQSLAVFSFQSITAGTARYAQFTAAYDGTISTATVSLGTGYTGNLKCSIFASSATPAPTTVLGSANVVVNPASGSNTLTFGTPITVTKGAIYWIGFDSDTSSGTWNIANSLIGCNSTTAYASFPAASPAVTSGINQVTYSVTITLGNNTSLVNEAQQDGAATYVYSSNVGDTDLYGIAAIAATPASTIAVTTRAFVQKSDAGSRSGKVVLKSGGTTVDSGSAALSTTWSQFYRTDVTDPNTGSAWTAVAVNAVQVGVSCTA